MATWKVLVMPHNITAIGLNMKAMIQYWKSISDEERFEKIKVPVHTFGGWFDIFLMGTINGYTGMKNQGGSSQARSGARMIIGPWGHGSSQSYGDVDFTPAAHIDQFETELHFFDYHLKGTKTV